MAKIITDKREESIFRNFMFGLLMVLMLAACSGNSSDKEVICTEEFRIIGVAVSGGRLSDFYTIRVSTNDTIRYTENEIYPIVNWYPILDDSYQSVLEGNQEDFYFIGKSENDIVIEQFYNISADKCHIFKVNGPESILINSNISESN